MKEHKFEQQRGNQYIPVSEIAFSEFFKFCKSHSNLVQRFGLSRSCSQNSICCNECAKHDKKINEHKYRDVKDFLKIVKSCKIKNEQYVSDLREKFIPKFLNNVQEAFKQITSELDSLAETSNLMYSLVSMKNKENKFLKNILFNHPKDWEMNTFTCEKMHKLQNYYQKIKALPEERFEQMMEDEVKFAFTRRLFERKLLFKDCFEQKRRDKLLFQSKEISGNIQAVISQIQRMAEENAQLEKQRESFTIKIEDSFLHDSQNDQEEEKIDKQNQNLQSLLKMMENWLENQKITSLNFLTKIPSSNQIFWESFYRTVSSINFRYRPNIPKNIIVISQEKKEICKIFQQTMESEMKSKDKNDKSKEKNEGVNEFRLKNETLIIVQSVFQEKFPLN